MARTQRGGASPEGGARRGSWKRRVSEASVQLPALSKKQHRWGEGPPLTARSAAPAAAKGGGRGSVMVGPASARGASSSTEYGRKFGESHPASHAAREFSGARRGSQADSTARIELREDGFFSFTHDLGIRLPSLVIRFDDERTGAAARTAADHRRQKREEWRKKSDVYKRAKEQKQLSLGLVSRFRYAAGEGAAPAEHGFPALVSTTG